MRSGMFDVAVNEVRLFRSKRWALFETLLFGLILNYSERFEHGFLLTFSGYELSPRFRKKRFPFRLFNIPTETV